ncbi:hypothetical protein [Aestuariimicrobium ganziense]|uniref:hypothetical protein n=1 Tax=Aestuariimicrobium ganziense TaxID=2773677 RepID=UPI0019406F8C|nr:hypothetical protein [Aestuariimicrobium ganziense]
MQTPEAFVVGHSTVSSAGRVARSQAMLKRTFFSLALFLGIVVVLQFVSDQGWTARSILVSLIPGLVIWAAFLVWRLVSLRSARADLARVGSGEAFRIDHAGIHLADSGQVVGWGQISELKAEGSLRGAGPLLVLDHAGGRYQVPLSFLDTLPGTIDSALRAYSGGRRGLNLSNLDSLNAF